MVRASADRTLYGEGVTLFDTSTLTPNPDLVSSVAADSVGGHHTPVESPAAQTSLQAAIRNAGRSGSQRRRVLTYMCAVGTATNVEIEAALGLARPSGSNRRGELEALGCVEATRLTRPTQTGAPAVVYRVTELGRAVHAALGDE